MKSKLKKVTYVISCGFIVLSVSAQSASTKNENSLTVLAKKIVELRLEVETLNNELLASKTELQSKLKGKGSRVANLEVQIGQEDVRQKQLLEKLAAVKVQIEKVKEGEDLTPLVKSNIVRIKENIEAGLPFQMEKRLKDANDIFEKLNGGVITAESALGRTWALYEDELRLTRENALHRQTIILNGSEKLATVAKIGMMSMYFHTIDNKVGLVQKNPEDKFVYVEENDPKRKEMIFTLIDGLKKQIRYGRYDLPLAMNNGGQQ
jgi:hypothetical protein